MKYTEVSIKNIHLLSAQESAFRAHNLSKVLIGATRVYKWAKIEGFSDHVLDTDEGGDPSSLSYLTPITPLGWQLKTDIRYT